MVSNVRVLQLGLFLIVIRLFQQTIDRQREVVGKMTKARNAPAARGPALVNQKAAPLDGAWVPAPIRTCDGAGLGNPDHHRTPQ